MYAGWTRGPYNDESALRFIVFNASDETLTYRSQFLDGPFARLTVNGRELALREGCRNGYQDYYISPNSSAVIYVSRFHFTERPRKSDSVTAGFYLRGEFSEGRTITSEPFFLPDKFRMGINPQ
jgi:hypothetical protein